MEMISPLINGSSGYCVFFLFLLLYGLCGKFLQKYLAAAATAVLEFTGLNNITMEKFFTKNTRTTELHLYPPYKLNICFRTAHFVLKMWILEFTVVVSKHFLYSLAKKAAFGRHFCSLRLPVV